MFISSRIADTFQAEFKSVQGDQTLRPEQYIFVLLQKGIVAITEDSEKWLAERGDVILLHPGHTYQIREISQNQVFLFYCNPNFFNGILPEGYRLECNSCKAYREDYDILSHNLEQIGLMYTQGNHENGLISALYALLDTLQQGFTVSPEQKEQDSANTIDARVLRIQQFIEKNYHLPVYLQTLADEMYLSPQYLSKFIKQNMGITFNKYLNSVRLKHAYEELIHTDHAITEIAFNNGFSNTSAFNKMFREAYDISPTVYRKNQTPEVEELSKGIFAGTAVREDHPSASSIDLDVSFKNTKPYYPSWLDTINIGALSNALSESFHTIFSQSQKEMHFKYVRFNNVFDDEIIEYITDTNEFKFTNIDMIFDFFREIHIIPFIEICYKPAKISLTTQHFERQDLLFAKERSREQLIHGLAAMLDHFILRYGIAEVSKWRFEIWAKHDEALQYLETPGEYWDKFESFYGVIKEKVPDAAVGGPGYNTSNNTMQFRKILTEMANRQICPDFFSIYAYCYTPMDFEESMNTNNKTLFKPLSTDAAYLNHVFNIYKNMIHLFAPVSVPLYITEFNSGLNGYNHVAASAFQAAFIFKNVMSLFQETTCIAYWHFSDVTSEVLSGGPQIYATGMGLIEQHGIPQPGFFSYVLLSKLKGYLADAGTQHIAATDNRAHYQFMVSNYQHYSQSYCFTYQNRLGIANTYNVFTDAENKLFHIHLHDVPAGRYKCTVHILNRRYGSLIDKFQHILNYGKISQEELEFMLLNMQQDEVEYYKKCAIPRMEISYFENPSGTLSFTREMEPHEVYLIDLERRS